jgi:hypothetical protein
MKRLQIGNARIAALPIAMIHLNPVAMVEEQAAGATAPVLRFEQRGQSWIGVGMPSLSDTPVHPIAVGEFQVSSDRSSSWFPWTQNFAKRAMVRSTISSDFETLMDCRCSAPTNAAAGNDSARYHGSLLGSAPVCPGR